jgi:ribonuclease HIII
VTGTGAYIGGIDESGKGDFFGPIVIAAAAATAQDEALLQQIGVRDSKKITDGRALQIAAQLRQQIPHSVVVIMPPKYNELYQKIRNLNRLLAWGHARAMENLLDQSPCETFISDKFAKEEVLKGALMVKGRAVTLIQETGGEAHLPVAAASILARAEFLRRLDQLSQQWQIKFPKGASAQVDQTGKVFVEKHGEENLKEVAKMHFKNVRKIGDLVGRIL